MSGRRLRMALLLASATVLACDRPPRSDSPADFASDCPVDTVARHPDPVALVEEFVRRDAEGPFERHDLHAEWVGNALTCIENNTSDNYEVISAYDVEQLDARPDSVRVLVRRTRAFVVDLTGPDGTAQLEEAPSTWVDTVLVVRTPWEWRIDRLHAGAHRLPARALQELRLSPADSARLRQLVSSAGAAR